MQPAGTAEGNQCEVGGRVAFLHRDDAQRPEHALVDEVDDPRRGVVRVQSELGAELGDGGLGLVAVQLHLTAESRGGRWPSPMLASVTVAEEPPRP